MSDVVTTTVHGKGLSIRAIGDRIVVEVSNLVPARLEGSSILLPQTTQAKMPVHSGTVLAVAPSVKDVHPGDVVHWSLGAGLGIDSGRLRIIRRSDIFAKEYA